MKSIEVDFTKPGAAEPNKGHNRWHPDIPPRVEVELGEELVLGTRDGLDGQLNERSTNEDVRALDLEVVHPLTGPVFVKGAEPGDILEVEIRAIEPEPTACTAIIPGFGFLQTHFSFQWCGQQ